MEGFIGGPVRRRDSLSTLLRFFEKAFLITAFGSFFVLLPQWLRISSHDAASEASDLAAVDAVSERQISAGEIAAREDDFDLWFMAPGGVHGPEGHGGFDPDK